MVEYFVECGEYDVVGVGFDVDVYYYVGDEVV